jgi:hypothetical protein
MTSKALSPRQAAKASAAKTYHGSRCRKCGNTERRTDNGACVHCHIAGGQRWKRENKERVAENERTRRAKQDRADRLAYQRSQYVKHIEPRRAAARERERLRRIAEPEKVREYDRRRYRSNPEPKRAYARIYGHEWARNNPEKARAGYARWRSRGKTASPAWLKASGQQAAIEAFYAAKPAGMHVDHDNPLAGCVECGVVGLHVLANLQYLPRAVNQAKGAKCMACFLALDVVASDADGDCPR